MYGVPRVALPPADQASQANSSSVQPTPHSHRATAGDPDSFVQVLYRSASDGWRVGFAHFVANATTVLVSDARTGLTENVRPNDVVDPRVAAKLSDDDVEKLFESAEVSTAPRDESAARHRQYSPLSSHGAERGDGDEEHAGGASAPECVEVDDLACLHPSPLLFEGSTIDVLRCRHRYARQRVLSGEAEEFATVTTFAGDNVAYVLRTVPPSGIIRSANKTDEVTSIAQRVYAALRATNESQCVVASSDSSPFAETTATAYGVASLMNAPNNATAKLAAAMTIMQSFTHDFHGRQHALTEVTLLANQGKDYEFAASNISVSLVDAKRIADCPKANWEIVGFLAFALSTEEKERCYLPTRRSAKPPSCVDAALAQDTALVDRLRERYFVFCDALETMQFEVHLQLFIFARIAAAMHFLDVTFDAESGTTTNLSALRNASKLISADFNSLSKVVTNRQQCIAAARFLFMSTLRLLVSKLNAKLNGGGAVEGTNGVVTAVTLLSSFAPAPDHPLTFLDRGAHADEGPLDVHHLFRNALYEDITQRFYLTTEAELGQWQQEGFVVPRALQASLDPFDNYNVVRLLKAKGGVLSTLEQVLTALLPTQDIASRTQNDTALTADATAADTTGVTDGAEGDADGAAAAAADEDEVDDTPYFVPDRDAVAKMKWAAIPAGQETDADKPPKKAMPPVELPVRNDNLAMMAFIFASEITVAAETPGLKLEAGGEYLFTIAPAGNAIFWKKEKPLWTGNVTADFVALHVNTSFDCQLHFKPSGPKSKPVTMSFQLLIRKTPDDREAHNDLMNLLVRSVLQLSPKAAVSFVPTPVPEAPPAPAEDREREEAERKRLEEEAALAHAASQTPEAVAAANREKALAAALTLLKKLSKHNGCRYDEASNTLMVQHSFGPRVYAMPPLSAAGSATPDLVEGLTPWLTVLAPAFDPLRQYLLSETDVETQEALTVEDQASYVSTTPAMYRLECDATLSNVLAREKTRFWFVFVTTAIGGFNGELIEKHMNVGMLRAVRALRCGLPHNYLPVSTSYIIDNYLPVLPGVKRRAFRATAGDNARQRVFAEEICIAGGAAHVMGVDSVLIDAQGLLRLEESIQHTVGDAVLLTQRFARQAVSAFVVRRRVDAMATALTRDEEERNAVIAMRKWQLDHAAQTRQKRLALQEDEFAMRRAIADECWIEWVALQTQVQHELENAMQDIIANRIKQRQDMIKRNERQSQQVAVRALTDRIQQRILQQGTGLDAMVRKQLLSDSATRDRMDRMKRAHDTMLRAKEASEEQRAALEMQILDKAKRSDVVAKAREERRNVIRDELWHRQERERVVREQIERNRAVLEQRMQEELVIDHIGFEMSRRTKMELIERQNARRQELKKSFEEERKRHDEALLRNSKKQWTQTAKRERTMSQQRKDAEEKARRERVSLWQAQEKERRNAERAKAEEANRQKTLTRKLLKAHSLLCTPMLFEQGVRGETRLVVAPTAAGGSSTARARSKSATGAVSDMEGFVMSSGNRTYSRLLPERVWDGVIAHHEEALMREGQYTPSARRVTRGASLLRSASPRSVASL